MSDLVKQFYTYWHIQNNQVLLIMSLKKLFDHFFNEIISKGWYFFLDSCIWIKTSVSYTPSQAQKQLRLLNPLEENFWKNKTDLESECSEDSSSLYEIKIKGLQAKLQWKMLNVAFTALFWIVRQELFGQMDTHTDIKIVFIFA